MAREREGQRVIEQIVIVHYFYFSLHLKLMDKLVLGELKLNRQLNKIKTFNFFNFVHFLLFVFIFFPEIDMETRNSIKLKTS